MEETEKKYLDYEGLQYFVSKLLAGEVKGKGLSSHDLSKALMRRYDSGLDRALRENICGAVKRRCIPLGAQPGNVYQNYYYLVENGASDGWAITNRNCIRLYMFNPNEETRTMEFDLTPYYVYAGGEMQPLSECITKVESCKNFGAQFDVAYKIEGKTLTVVVRNNNVREDIPYVPILAEFGYTYSHLKYRHITVVRDAEGRTVFHLFNGSECDRVLQPVSLEEFLDDNMADLLERKRPTIFHDRPYEIEIWKMGRSGWKWRKSVWRRDNPMCPQRITQKTLFVRIRRRNKNGDRSAWSYFKVRSDFEKGTVKVVEVRG